MCIYINTEYWPERSFKTLNLDMLTVFTFAPRYSGFNCIEHIWSSLSNKLAGITFSSVYPGDKEPPGKLSRLSQPKNPEKKVIFNKAMWSTRERSWKDTSFDTFPVYIETIRYNDDILLCNDYDKAKSFLRAPIRYIPQYFDFVKEFKDMFRHADKRANEIIFIWSEDSTCCREFRSIELKHFFKKRYEAA